jgi:hypothetical protein
VAVCGLHVCQRRTSETAAELVQQVIDIGVRHAAFDDRVVLSCELAVDGAGAIDQRKQIAA